MCPAFLVTGNQQFQEIASNMEALPQIRALLERLAQPVEPYETAQAAADRSSQEQVSKQQKCLVLLSTSN